MSFRCSYCHESKGGLFSIDCYQNWPFTCTNSACGIVVCSSCATKHSWTYLAAPKCPRCGRDCTYPGQSTHDNVGEPPPVHRTVKSAIPDDIFVFRFQNTTGRTVHLQIWSITRDHFWPSPNEVFILNDDTVRAYPVRVAEYTEQTITGITGLRCGEILTWGAWLANDSSTGWNGGNTRDFSPRKVFDVTRGGKSTDIITLRG